MKPSPANALRRGMAAETVALDWLRRQGVRLVKRNYRCQGGEIDLIVTDGQVLAFVEVRQRRDDRFGNAAESITPTKQRRLALAARHFLATRTELPPCRFDVIGVDGHSPATVHWIKDAFVVSL